MFRGRELLRIWTRLDRAARERAESRSPTDVRERADGVEADSRRLRGLLRRPAGE